MNTDRYLDLCQTCVRRARALGAEWCDVAAGASRDISVTIEKSGIKAADAGQGESAAVRVFIAGGMGYMSVGGSDPDDIQDAVERAVALAKETTPDPDFRALPAPQPADEVPGRFDDAVAAMTVEDVVRIAAANLEAGLALEPQAILSGSVGLDVGEG
ncbi:MAG: DNA gyrase modulator, partial [Phycisphaerae bacterium]